jgi:hypothetical protein
LFNFACKSNAFLKMFLNYFNTMAFIKSMFVLVLCSFVLHSCKKIDYGAAAINGTSLVLAPPDAVYINGVFLSSSSSLDLSATDYTYGFCYSLTRSPVIPGLNTVSKNYTAGSFSAMCTNIEYGKMYYVKSFVANGFATAYSNMDSFFVPLYIYTDTVRNITARSFDVSIYTLPAIADSITERGVCYDTLALPDINSRKMISTVSDTGTILIRVNDTLNPGKTYYLRSYFIANGRPVYGNQVSFVPAGYAGSYGYVVFDKGSAADGWRYIEAALDSISTTTIKWGCPGTSVPGTLTAAGAGFQNTDTIISVCSDTLAAANFCRSLTLKGKTDWYLPSVDELKALYQLKLAGIIEREAVLFSSSEASANNCFVVDFSTGQQQQLAKNSTAAGVWPVRRY